MEKHDMYIGGRWSPARGDGTLEVVNPTTSEPLARVPEASAEDVDDAVAAAREAFPGWAATPVGERQALLRRIAEGLEARRHELADLITREVGMPVKQCDRMQVGLPIRSFVTMAELLDGYEFEERVGTSMVVKDPIGVVAAIAPWNLPLNQLAAKIAPALAAGCTLVVKPSEVTPLNALVLAEVIDAAGAPDGVVNLVMGTGPTVGQALVGHPQVDMISFTGSTRAGRQIGEVAAATVKRVALELGGKSPAILLEDCDFEHAVPAVVSACYSNSGQSCIALSRMLVPRARLAEAEEAAKRAAESFVVGDPFHEETKLGPLVSAAQLTRVRSYIAAGLEEGARLVTGGVDPPFDGSPPGYFVRPTVFSEVKSDMKIAQEEIFGPVLSIMPYDDEADAVSLANDTIFGLAAGVWSTDPEHAQRVARDLRAGQVFLNGTRSSEVLPFGGYKQSGNGREWGKWGLEEYLEIKALHA